VPPQRFNAEKAVYSAAQRKVKYQRDTPKLISFYETMLL